MDIDHIHFYVEDAQQSRDWFVHTLGFEAIAERETPDTITEVVRSGPVYFVLSSPLNAQAPVAAYLQQHPSGVGDVALQVSDLEAAIARAVDNQAELLKPIQQESGLRSAVISGWGSLRHTLLERTSKLTPLLPAPGGAGMAAAWRSQEGTSPPASWPLIGIDHVVLNVAAGDLSAALAWYQQVLGFQPQRTFEIYTCRSGLCSQVMVHPDGTAQLPINEPITANSQIQEFLDFNRGPGIQHIALRTSDILQAIAQLRRSGLSFLEVPTSYYQQLRQRFQHFSQSLDWSAIAAQQVLVDWQDATPEAVLLQTFTRPIFDEPTFFFEVIERRHQAQGFGEGNFLALFEAIEREQIKRGGLV